MESIIRSLQPRDDVSATRTVSVLTMVAASVTVAFASISAAEVGPTELSLTIAVGVLTGLAGWRMHRPHHVRPIGWAVAPLLAVAVIVGLDFVTQDASVSAQVFLFFPVLYAASQLPRNGVVVVTAAAIAGEMAVTYSLLPLTDAVVATGYISAVLLATAGLLLHAAERREALMAQLHRAAAVDSLTGLVTRRVLDQAAQSALTGAAHPEGTALLLIDVDEFKRINDQYGHPAGDAVLVQLSGVVEGICRPSDVVSRLGGDEIAVLLVGSTMSMMSERAVQLLETVRGHPFLIEGAGPVKVTVSVGVAHAPTEADDLPSLYRAADAALYQAKRAGRDRVARLVL